MMWAIDISQKMLRRMSAIALTGTLAFGSTAVAQTSNFGTVTISGSTPTSVGPIRGYTEGSFSLSSISNRDRHNNMCLGFAESTPDHVLVLEQDIQNLSIRVDSGGGDTTLLIQGPGANVIRCGDSTDRSPDASVEDTNWQAGQYKIWVGSF